MLSSLKLLAKRASGHEIKKKKTDKKIYKTDIINVRHVQTDMTDREMKRLDIPQTLTDSKLLDDD